MGDPRGIGPEIIYKSLSELPDENIEISIVGDEKLLKAEADRQDFNSSQVKLYDPGSGDGPGEASIRYIDQALQLIENYPGSAFLTAPVEKKAVAEYIPNFTGHTGYLAEKAQNAFTVMSFISPKMKMSLLTEHLPLKEVPKTIDKDMIINHIDVVRKDLKKYFKIFSPRFVLASLNPHAGESGLLGWEEEENFIPAVKDLKKNGVNVDGPFSADYALRAALDGKYDFILSPYHDQLLPAFKVLLAPSVNMTLGLGYPRVSPDHGPAIDLKEGPADYSSMKAALELAVHLADG